MKKLRKKAPRRSRRNAPRVTVVRGGKTYRIYDAYPSRETALQYARDIRTKAGSVFPPPIQTAAVVVDMGPGAGRLRYGLFIRKRGAYGNPRPWRPSKNPPYHCVVDSKTRKVVVCMNVTKRDWAGDIARKKAHARARQEADKVGRPMEIHFWLRRGKKGDLVSPLSRAVSVIRPSRRNLKHNRNPSARNYGVGRYGNRFRVHVRYLDPKTAKMVSKSFDFVAKSASRAAEYAILHMTHDLGVNGWIVKMEALDQRRNPITLGTAATAIFDGAMFGVGGALGAYAASRIGVPRANPGLTKKAREYISRKIPVLIREGYPQDQAVAIAYSMARKRGYKVPRRNPRCNHNPCDPVCPVRNPRKTQKNPLLQTLGLAANPSVKIPFRDGQKVPVERAREWIRRNAPHLLKDFEKGVRLQTKANRAPRHVVWKLLKVGDPRRLESMTTLVHYGDTPESVYMPPKGSKKGTSTPFKHDWGEGSGREKPIPVLVSTDGKMIVHLLGRGQKVSDWMRG